MRRLLCLFIAITIVILAKAQYKVTFILREKTSITHDSIFVAGTFTNWDSTPNPAFLLRPSQGNEKSITLTVPAGVQRYKFHRGSWLKVEKQYYGGEVADRVVTIRQDTTFTDSVFSWRDELIADKKLALLKPQPDSVRLNIVAGIAGAYSFYPENYNADSALHYAEVALDLLEQTDDKARNEQRTTQYIQIREITASLMHALGNYPKSLAIRLENLKLAENEPDRFTYIQALHQVISDYVSMKDYNAVRSNAWLLQAVLRTADKENPRYQYDEIRMNHSLATAWFYMNNIDSALFYASKIDVTNNNVNNGIANAFGSQLLADIHAAKGMKEKAFEYYRHAVVSARPMGAIVVIATSYAGIAKLYQRTGNTDSALYYALQAVHELRTNTLDVLAWGENADSYVADISPLIADLYKQKGNLDSAYSYLRLSVTLKDSLYNSDKIRQIQLLSFNESIRQQQLEQQQADARRDFETRIKIYILVGAIAAFLVIALILYRGNRQKQKVNAQLTEQKVEIEKAYTELKTMQAQLIQSEKMASLGELTAGIAHEIQNPLNFVNNFSEVNKELLEELQSELSAGNIPQASEIANDIKDNSEKITQHGKRADSIVKGMLQHSRKSTGEKELVDINALADEYLKLAYHGMRAKEKSFNVTMKTDYAPGLEKVKVIPQDIGRVLLNIYTNAFHALNDKRMAVSNSGPSEKYDPTIEVKTEIVPVAGSTQQADNRNQRVRITISDNGPGIPVAIRDKIFQPFFTTKPTGQGTGLGLSLAYDIIKAQGGTIEAGTSASGGASFIIYL